MNTILISVGVLAAGIAACALARPGWPNGDALGLLWRALILTGCPHTQRQWRFRSEHLASLDCMSCRPPRGVQAPK